LLRSDAVVLMPWYAAALADREWRVACGCCRPMKQSLDRVTAPRV